MGKIIRSFGTHDGHFHGDEVTACALLLVNDLIDKEKIFRTREKTVLDKCEYVCDVGGVYEPRDKLFDHHQIDYTGQFSSAGMILLDLKDKEIISCEMYDFFNKNFVKGVDAHDIGNVKLEVGVCTFSQVIEGFVPLGENISDIDLDKAFIDAIDFTVGFIKRLIEKFYYFQEAKKIVQVKMKSKTNFLVFDKAVSWVDSFFELGGRNHPALFIIMPAGKFWKLRAVPPSYEDRMNTRIPLPKEWAGLRDNDLQKVSNIDGAIFCHKGRFISIWKTKKDALLALKYIFTKEGIDSNGINI